MLTVRQGLVFGGLFAVAVATPAACFYPSYTFDDTGAGGAGAEPSTSTTTTTTGGGATTTTTSSTTSSTVGPGGGGNGGVGNEGGGGATSSSSSSGNGGTGGVLGPEDCTNGIDDNGDGMPDCKDPQCTAAYKCVSAVPAGWTGYFSLYDGAVANDPECDATGDYPTSSSPGQSGLVAPPATCSMCACSSPTGEVCNGPTTVEIDDVACGGLINCEASLTLNAADGSCNGTQLLSNPSTCGANSGMFCDMGTQQCNLSASTAEPTVAPGSCTASGGTVTKQPPTFSGFGRSCGGVLTTGKGCNGTQVCLPKPDPIYASGICVSKVGANMCPAATQFTEQHIFYTSVSDTRDCTGCSCSSSSGATCAANVTLYSATNCTSQVASFAAGSCANIANPVIGGKKVTVTSQPSGGSCTKSGGQPTGMATPNGPTTYCCVP